MDRTIKIRIRGTWLRYFVVVLVTVLVAAPATVWASHGFTDVVDNNTFHDDIDWLADNGITKGCNPPSNDEFCPKDKVSREQMAAFMKRLATNQVVDAASVEGLTAAELSPRAAFASSDDVSGQGGTPLTTTITVPVDGILIINASVGLRRFDDVSTNGVSCFVDIDETMLTGSLMNVEVGGSGDINETCATGGAAVVAAGVHTIDFGLAIAPDTVPGRAFLTVLFVPFDANGQTPTP